MHSSFSLSPHPIFWICILYICRQYRSTTAMCPRPSGLCQINAASTGGAISGAAAAASWSGGWHTSCLAAQHCSQSAQKVNYVVFQLQFTHPDAMLRPSHQRLRISRTQHIKAIHIMFSALKILHSYTTKQHHNSR